MAGGACVVGGMHDRGCVWWGVCMAGGIHGRGGMHGRGHVWQGACMAGGVCMARGACVAGGHAWHTRPPPREILRDTVNERAVRILLECILVIQLFRCSRCSGNDGRIL